MTATASPVQTFPIGYRVRIEGNATYMWGMVGTVVGHQPGAVVVQLDQSTGVGVPAGFPAGRPYAVDPAGLVLDYSNDEDERHPDDECAAHPSNESPAERLARAVRELNDGTDPRMGHTYPDGCRVTS